MATDLRFMGMSLCGTNRLHSVCRVNTSCEDEVMLQKGYCLLYKQLSVETCLIYIYLVTF